MRIEKIKGAWFLNGIRIAESVRQSLALKADATIETPSLGGVYRVDDMQASEYGLGIFDRGRWFLVPWPNVTSCEFLAEPPIETVPTTVVADDESRPFDEVKVDPAPGKRFGRR